MSRYESNSISPIKQLSSSKPYQTPAKYLTQRNQTIYQEQYYKQKSQRLEEVVKELKEQTRILETQNKQLKTQIQLYRESKGPTSYLAQRKLQNTERPNLNTHDTQELQRLLKQIRILKNNHELQITEYHNQQKRLNKKVTELQDLLQQNQLSHQSLNLDAQAKLQEKNKQLEKEIKQLRKSVVEYMQQRDQNEQKLQKIRLLLQEKDQQINSAQNRENSMMEEKVSIMEEKVALEEKLNQLMSHSQANPKNLQQKSNTIQNIDWDLTNSQRESRRKDSLYQFGMNSIKRNTIKQSHLTVHTFNGARHVPAEQAFDLVQSFKSQINRLEAELERNSLLHVKEIDNLNYTIERCQKQLKEKDSDIVSLLTKVKPLMVDKSKIGGKENLIAKKEQFQEEKDTAGRNAFGMRMLDMFLKKYKLEAF